MQDLSGEIPDEVKRHTASQILADVNDGDPASAELMRKIWDLKKKGKDFVQIAMIVNMTPVRVRQIYKTFYDRFMGPVSKGFHEDRMLDFDRANDLIAAWLPAALAGKVAVERTDDEGRVYTDEEWRHSLAATKLVLEAIMTRMKILSAYGPEKDHRDMDVHNIILELNRRDPIVANGNGHRKELESPEEPVDMDFDFDKSDR